MLEGLRYKRGKNRPYLIPEIHLLAVWADIMDNRQERIKLADSLDEIYARRKMAIDSADPELLLIEYPTDKQDAADRYNEGKINAKELMDRLTKTPKREFEHKSDYEAYEKYMDQIREKESEMFKGRKIYCYGWNGNSREYAKKIERLTSWAKDVMKEGHMTGMPSPGKKHDTLIDGYIKEYKKTRETTREKEEKMARNIQKIMLKEKDKKTAAICGADHFMELYTKLGAKTTKETDALYRVCLEFNQSKKLRDQAYERALALAR